jgi:hypothetical protein
MFAPLDPGGLCSEDIIQCKHECVRPRRPLDRAVDAQGNSAAIPENASHLTEGPSLVGEKLQSQLAENHIEAVG